MTRSSVEKTGKTGLAALAVLAIMALAWTVPAGAANNFVPGFYHTTRLMAGQSIEVGEVVVEVVEVGTETNIVVTYNTDIADDGWELVEAHLWVGSALGDMPHTKKGNPKIGNFPYASGNITRATSYEFSIPINDVYCGTDGILFAAHAVVSKADSKGNQTETAWGEGPEFVAGRSWGTYITIPCDNCDNLAAIVNTEVTIAQWIVTVTISADFNTFLDVGVRDIPSSFTFENYVSATSQSWTVDETEDGETITVTYYCDRSDVGGAETITLWGQPIQGTKECVKVVQINFNGCD